MTLYATVMRDTERQRLRALVEGDMDTAAALHADDYQLITPRGFALTKLEYLGDIASGQLRYLVFEAVSDIEVRGNAQVALLRYVAQISVADAGGRPTSGAGTPTATRCGTGAGRPSGRRRPSSPPATEALSRPAGGPSLCSLRLSGGWGGGLMAEGLDPIEAGKKLHELAESQHGEGSASGGHDAARERHSRLVQICEAVLLSLVTITAAWAGYSAARWGTASRVDIARSSTLRNIATRDDLTAISLRNFDASTFNAWFIAFTLNSPQKEAIAVRRFRPQFRVAFDAWLATDPLHNPQSPPGPTYMPQYKLPAQAQAAALDSAADAKFDAGNQDGLIGDNYVRITVFLAAVLFLVGIGSSFKLAGVRYALITFGSVLLILSIVLILRQPGLPPG